MRGEGGNNSFLLRSKDKKKCCLGFFSLACGFNEDQIRNKITPNSLSGIPQIGKNINPVYNKLLDSNIVCEYNSNTFRKYSGHLFAMINDDIKISDEVRENLLKEYFNQIGVEVIFIP